MPNDTNGNVQKFLENLQNLLLKSEDRIDKQNDIMNSMLLTFSRATEQYMNQIDNCQRNRDEITQQNTDLIKTVQKQEDTIVAMSQKIDSVLMRLLECKMGGSENNFNIQ